MNPSPSPSTFGKYLQPVLIVTLVAAIAQSAIFIGGHVISSSDESDTAAVVQSIAAPRQVTVSSVTAKVSYEKKNEVSLNVTTKTKITATDSDLVISERSFPVGITNKTFNLFSGEQNVSTITSNVSKNTDGTFTVKKGTSASFTSVAKFNPKSLIAGQYYAVLEGVTVNNGSAKLTAPSNKSNLVTVVGEASPYISLLGKGIYGSKDTVIAKGVRLGSSLNVTLQQVDDKGIATSYSKTFTLKSGSSATQFKFNLGTYSIPEGLYLMSVVNPKLGNVAGKSNQVYFQVLAQDKLVTAKVTNGVLSLGYHASQGEISLGSAYTVTIKAGTTDLNFTRDSFYALAQDSNYLYSMAMQSLIKKIDDKPAVLPFVLKAGKTTTFSIVSYANPNIMFAGSYAVSLYGIYPTNPAGSKYTYISVGENKSNYLTIVGETSPYITSISPEPVVAGQTMTINGRGLGGTTLSIDGVSPGYINITRAEDGTSLSFVAPASLADGSHTLVLNNDGTGNSNTFYFQSVGGPVVSPIVVDLISTDTNVTAGTAANDDVGTFRIKFKVTAVSDAIYISSTTDPALGGSEVVVNRAGIPVNQGLSSTLTNITDSNLSAAGTYVIEAGDSEVFELTTVAQLPAAGNSGMYQAALKSIGWGADANDSTPNNSYTSNLDAFKTSYIVLN